MIPGGEEEPEKFKKGQKFALADMILHCKPTESHVPDAHFIHSLRKMAANQVALMMKNEIHAELKPPKPVEETAQPNLSVVKEGT
jgi:hypothetical protein